MIQRKSYNEAIKCRIPLFVVVFCFVPRMSQKKCSLICCSWRLFCVCCVCCFVLYTVLCSFSPCNSRILECHLCSSKVASPNTTILASLFCRACSIASVPPSKSSTYRSSRNVVAIFTFPTACFWRWFSSVLPRRNCDWFKLNIAFVNLSTWASCVFRPEIQWKHSTSLLFPAIRICRNTCFKSPVLAIGYIQFLTIMSYILFCSGGPVYKQSFNDGWFSLSWLNASYTIQSFVLSGVSLITGLWGK